MNSRRDPTYVFGLIVRIRKNLFFYSLLFYSGTPGRTLRHSHEYAKCISIEIIPVYQLYYKSLLNCIQVFDSMRSKDRFRDQGPVIFLLSV
jgi:hypothetical protein